MGSHRWVQQAPQLFQPIKKDHLLPQPKGLYNKWAKDVEPNK